MFLRVWNEYETLILTKRGKDKKTPTERCGIEVKSLNRWEGATFEEFRKWL